MASNGFPSLDPLRRSLPENIINKKCGKTSQQEFHNFTVTSLIFEKKKNLK